MRIVLAADRDPAVVFSLAEVLQAQMEFPEARALYQEILALYADEPAALCNLGTIEADVGDAQRAIALYKTALRHHPALAQRLAGDPEAAAQAYAAARRLDATLADALKDTHDYALTAAAGAAVHGDRLAVLRAALGAAELDGPAGSLDRARSGRAVSRRAAA
ncbi:MAG: tetratricopeptide repeat protein [Alphaproteobacteria bacterium]|nr:tetratricopeptide repeat protein [Alphaproteobacteria bacterium]